MARVISVFPIVLTSLVGALLCGCANDSVPLETESVQKVSKSEVSFMTSSSSTQEGSVHSVSLSRNNTNGRLVVPIKVQQKVAGSSVTVPGSLVAVFEPGHANVTISLSINRDNMTESGESITLTLPAQDDSITAGAIATHKISIAASFSKARVNFSTSSVQLVEGVATNVEIMRQGGDLSRPLRVRLKLASPRGDDVRKHFRLSPAPTSTLTYDIPAKKASLNINVEALSDVLAENRTQFTYSVIDDSTYDLGSTSSVSLIEKENDKPMLSFAAATYKAVEGNSILVTVVRSGPYLNKAFDARLIYSVRGADQDIQGLPSSIHFAANQRRISFRLFIRKDSIAEHGESYAVKIVKTGDFMLGTYPQTVIQIAPNGAGPVVISWIEDSELKVTETAATYDIVVHREGGDIGKELKLVITGAGTAKPGLDYSLPAALVFKPKAKNAVLRLNILNDSKREGEEAFQIRIKDSKGGVLARKIVRILAND